MTWLLESAAVGYPPAMDLLIQHQTALKWVGKGRWTKTSVLLRLLGTPHLRQRLRRNDVTPPARVDLSWFTWRAYPAEDQPDHAALQRVSQLIDLAFKGDHSVRQALRGVATGPILKRQGKMHGWDPDGPPRVAWLRWRNFSSIGSLATAGGISRQHWESGPGKIYFTPKYLCNCKLIFAPCSKTKSRQRCIAAW